MNKLYLFFILLIGTFLRFYNNTAVALWHDEAFSALYIRYSWGEMVNRIILDVHPPLYYFVLRLWAYVFGDSLLSLRSLSVLLGVATMVAVYYLVKAAFSAKGRSAEASREGGKNNKLALLAAFFVAINPFQIQYALEARMYTLGTFLVVISCFLLVRALEENRWKWWLLYSVAAAACLYTHYFLIFSVAAQGLFVIFYLLKNHKIHFDLSSSNLPIKAMGSYVLAGLLFIPWIPSFLEQNSRVAGGFWITKPDRWSVPGTLWKMAAGGQGATQWKLLLVTALSLIVIVYFLRKAKESYKWLLVLNLVIPFMGAGLLSLKNPIYLDRYFVFASVFASVILALALSYIPGLVYRRLITTIFVIFTLVKFFSNWTELGVKNLVTQRQINYKPGMAAASQYINNNVQADDKIYFGSSFIFFTFKYYNHTRIAPKLISTGPLSTIPHYSGTAILTEDDLILEQRLHEQKKNDNIWLVWTTGFGGSKPNVPGNWRQIDQNAFKDTPDFKGEIFITHYQIN